MYFFIPYFAYFKYVKDLKRVDGPGLIKWAKRLFTKVAFKARLNLHYMLFPRNFWLCGLSYTSTILPTAFLDNHDLNRILFDLDNDVPLLKLAATILFEQHRQPVVLYYGTEIGMTQKRSIWGIPYGGNSLLNLSQ